MTKQDNLKSAFGKVKGGIQTIADACDISPRAIYKWLARGKLPRTEYTGETSYAKKIAELPGAEFSADDLLYPDRQKQEAA